jgi:O-antigen ligase
MAAKALIQSGRQGTAFTDPVEGRIWKQQAEGREPRVSRPALDRLAFGGLLCFTALLYVRPSDLLMPAVMSNVPFAKVAILIAILSYVAMKAANREAFTIWPIEVRMIVLLCLIGVALTPVATLPKASVELLLNQFLKVVCIFILLVNLIDSPRRLHSMLRLLVICGTVLAALTVRKYLVGEMEIQDGERITGYVGVFADPNDIAASFNIFWPIGFALALKSRGLARAAFMLCVVLLIFGVIVTFSRGGFLGLIGGGGLLLWNLRRHHRLLTASALALALAGLLAALQTNYGARLSTIFQPQEDETASAQVRLKLLNHGIMVALNHLVIGVGIGNFTEHSLRDMKAHNSYVEVAAELGLAGLLVYLLLILAPMVPLRRIMARTANGRDPARGPTAIERECHYLSVAFQSAIISYLICSFFLSIEYGWYIYYPVALAVAFRTICYTQLSFIAPFANQSNGVTGEGGRFPGVIWRLDQC